MEREVITSGRLRELLLQLRDGPFATAATILLGALANSGDGVAETRVGMCVVRDLRSTYRIRARRLREQGEVVPGYQELASLLCAAPDEERVMLVPIPPEGWVGEPVVGALFVSADGVSLGCFADASGVAPGGEGQ
jgi:hypothetical protein